MTSGRSKESHSFAAISAVGPESSNGAYHLDVLFDQYSRLVFWTAYKVLGDPIEAEDVVQEVFLYIHRKSQLFDPSRGNVKAWIARIACSRALDRKIHLARRPSYTLADIDSRRAWQPADLEHEVESKLNHAHLEKAFSQLSYMQRRTIEFFYFEGLNLRDISEQLREPLGSVRHHLYRGLERLRKSSVLHNLL